MTRTSILLVSSEAVDAKTVRAALPDDEPVQLVTVRSYRSALVVLAKDRVTVIVCNEVLPDGSWKDLLGQTAILNDPPRLIVMAATDNVALWAEAISLGAYDVLAKPMNGEEVSHCLAAASRPQARLLTEHIA